MKIMREKVKIRRERGKRGELMKTRRGKRESWGAEI
jgi:hypothetical protein